MEGHGIYRIEKLARVHPLSRVLVAGRRLDNECELGARIPSLLAHSVIEIGDAIHGCAATTVDTSGKDFRPIDLQPAVHCVQS